MNAVSQPAPMPAAIAEKNAIRVLVIDDDPAYRHLCIRFLAKNQDPSFDVVAVSNAESGLEECKKGDFDCLLVDYTLPDLSGTQVIRRLENKPDETAPPIIIMTASGGEAAATESVRAGAVDYLAKNVISPESLVRAVNNAVEKGKLKKSIESRSRELEDANSRLSANNEQIQRFYQSVSHEVKTPLAAAREFIAIVLDGIGGPITDDQKEMLTHAIDSCDQITAHFNDLIEMTRLDAKKIALNLEVGRLENVLARCFAAADSAIVGKQLYLKKRVVSAIPKFAFDCNRIIQVLSNLLGNAIKFTESGGTITVLIDHDEELKRLTITVADTGVGIAPDDIERVFERLYQVDNSGSELMGAGLGLGLSIAKEIVTLHGGQMYANSVEGEGSAFSFWLPTEITKPDIVKEQQ